MYFDVLSIAQPLQSYEPIEYFATFNLDFNYSETLALP